MLGELQRMELYKQINPNELSTQQFLELEKEIRNPDSYIISDEYFDFRFWCNGEPSRQEQFAKFIAKKLSCKKGARILEVGGGRTGRLSRLLSEEGFKMTCIDPKLEVNGYANIEFIKEAFDYQQFDLTNYDYVVALEPCEATEHVVRACLEQKKPFMISLCEVPHKLISGEEPSNLEEWYDYLVNISSEEVKLRHTRLSPSLTAPMLKSNKF